MVTKKGYLMIKIKIQGLNMGNSNFVTSSLLSVPALLLHVLALPVFFLGFILGYQSTWQVSFLNAGLGTVFNALMLMCILIGVLSASRIPMSATRRHLHLNWWQYGLWSLAEVIVFASFAALYMALIHGDYGYFPALKRLCLVTQMITSLKSSISDTQVLTLSLLNSPLCEVCCFVGCE